MEPDESSSNNIDGDGGAGPEASVRGRQQPGIRTKSRMRVLHGSSTGGSRITLVPSNHRKLLPGWSRLQAYTHTGGGRWAG